MCEKSRNLKTHVVAVKASEPGKDRAEELSELHGKGVSRVG